jgi:hypothetical protein
MNRVQSPNKRLSGIFKQENIKLVPHLEVVEFRYFSGFLIDPVKQELPDHELAVPIINKDHKKNH